MIKEGGSENETLRTQLVEELKRAHGTRPEMNRPNFNFDDLLLSDLEMWRKIEDGTVPKEEFAAYQAEVKPASGKKVEEFDSRENFGDLLNNRQMQNTLRRPKKP